VRVSKIYSTLIQFIQEGQFRPDRIDQHPIDLLTLLKPLWVLGSDIILGSGSRTLFATR
jgi:hypothetical protein